MTKEEFASLEVGDIIEFLVAYADTHVTGEGEILNIDTNNQKVTVHNTYDVDVEVEISYLYLRKRSVITKTRLENGSFTVNNNIFTRKVLLHNREITITITPEANHFYNANIAFVENKKTFDINSPILYIEGIDSSFYFFNSVQYKLNAPIPHLF
jgi:hypothetical protein